MDMGKLSFEDFIVTVDRGLTEFVIRLHSELTEGGCNIEVKEAKSGYVVSYLYNKKAIANYVFRKKGIFARIYGSHIVDYMEILDTLPDGMVKVIQNAPVCKRLIDPDTCNSKCTMGYDFIMHSEGYQKCRNNAFMFLLCEENNPFIETFLKKELEVRSRT